MEPDAARPVQALHEGVPGALSLAPGRPRRPEVRRGTQFERPWPKSKSVLIGKTWGSPIICNDGVTIAKEFDLKDPEENLGAQVLRQAAERTGDAVGDGTTTSTVLAHAIYAEGLRNVTAGASAIDVKRGLERGLHVAVGVIKALSRPITTRAEKVQIATISAHNDAAIGTSSVMPSRRWVVRASSPSKKRRQPRPRSRSCRACSSTAATCRLIS
jgi:hypothetical protein